MYTVIIMLSVPSTLMSVFILSHYGWAPLIDMRASNLLVLQDGFSIGIGLAVECAGCKSITMSVCMSPVKRVRIQLSGSSVATSVMLMQGRILA